MGLLKKKEENIFYRLDNILSLKCKYNMIFGERSAGKTFACLEYVLVKYFTKGEQFAYLRRWEEDFKQKRGSSLFSGHSSIVKKLSKGEYDGVDYYSGRFYLYYIDDKEKKVRNPEPIGYAFALSTMEHDKSSSYPNITTVIFDEFMTRGMYIVDEFVVFCNCLSTIIRHRDNVKIFMLGNTVNKFAPYFKEMGLNNIKNMKPGQIDTYTYGQSDLTVAVEYTGTAQQTNGKMSDAYFAFNNPKLSMITGGAWELALYPHSPRKYAPKDVLLSYFINFDDELYQADIARVDDSIFTFIHRKTTPIQKENEDIIFSQGYDPRPNYKRDITRPRDKVSQKIWEFFLNDNVYYQDNDIGDAIGNYINWCKQLKTGLA